MAPRFGTSVFKPGGKHTAILEMVEVATETIGSEWGSSTAYANGKLAQAINNANDRKQNKTELTVANPQAGMPVLRVLIAVNGENWGEVKEAVGKSPTNVATTFVAVAVSDATRQELNKIFNKFTGTDRQVNVIYVNNGDLTAITREFDLGLTNPRTGWIARVSNAN